MIQVTLILALLFLTLLFFEKLCIAFTKLNNSHYKLISRLLYIILGLLIFSSLISAICIVPDDKIVLMILISLAMLIPSAAYAFLLFLRYAGHKEHEEKNLSLVFTFPKRSDFYELTVQYEMFSHAFHITDHNEFAAACIAAGIERCYNYQHASQRPHSDINESELYDIISNSFPIECRGYEARIQYDAQNNTFVGSIPELGPLYHFSGSNLDELQSAFSETLHNYKEYWAYQRNLNETAD